MATIFDDFIKRTKKKFSFREIARIENERALNVIPTGVFPLDLDVEVAQNLPFNYGIGYDERGKIIQFIEYDYDEEKDHFSEKARYDVRKPFCSMAKAIVERVDTDTVIGRKTADLLCSNLHMPFKRYEVHAGIAGFNAKALKTNDAYLSWNANWKFGTADHVKRTCSLQACPSFVAKANHACESNVVVGHMMPVVNGTGTGEYGAYSQRNVQINNGVGYSWPTEYTGFGPYNRAIMFDATTGLFNLNYYIKVTSSMNPSMFPTGTSSSVELKLTSDRGGGGVTAISVGSKTWNSASINFTNNVYTTYARWSVGNGWNYFNPGLNVSGGGSTSVTITGLTSKTTYTCTIQCRRDFNEVWGTSKAVSFTTNYPPAPTMGTINSVSVTPNSATASWSGFAYGGDVTTHGYGYYGFWVAGQSADTYTTGSGSGTITGLSPNTGYTFDVRLVDVLGQASGVATKSFTTAKPPAGDASGLSLSISNKTNTSFTLNISSGSSTTGGYGAYINVYRVNFNSSSYVNISGSSWTKTGLSPYTTYTVFVDFIDQYGTVANNRTDISVTTLPNPPTATSCTASNIAHNSVTLTGAYSIPTGASVSTRKFAIGNGWRSDVGANTETITGLTPNTTYTQKFQVVDNYGREGWIQGTNFTTLSTPPVANKLVVDEYDYDHATILIGGSVGSGASIPCYMVYYKKASESTYTQVEVDSSATSKLIWLKANTTYNIYFSIYDNEALRPNDKTYVDGVDVKIGSYKNSNIVTLTTLPVPPDARAVTVETLSYNSVTLRTESNVGEGASLNRIDIFNGGVSMLREDVSFEGGSASSYYRSVTLTGLSANTTYNLTFMVTDDLYRTDSLSFSFTTLKLPPVAGSLTVASLNPFDFTVSHSGFTVYDTIKQFEWKCYPTRAFNLVANSTAVASKTDGWTGGENTCFGSYKVTVPKIYGVAGNIVSVNYDYTCSGLTPVSGKSVGLRLQGSGNVSGWNAGALTTGYGFTASDGTHHGEYTFVLTEDHLKNDYWTVNIRTDYVTSGSFSIKNITANLSPLQMPFQVTPSELAFTSSGAATAKAFSELQELTQYTIASRILDNQGLYSNTVTATTTTPASHASIWFKKSGSWVRAKVWKRVGTTQNKVNKVYVKVNGVWKMTNRI